MVLKILYGDVVACWKTFSKLSSIKSVHPTMSYLSSTFPTMRYLIFIKNFLIWFYVSLNMIEYGTNIVEFGVEGCDKNVLSQIKAVWVNLIFANLY